jgi:sec-independent protein translocase protein TatA
MGEVGIPELLVILVIALLVFGGKKLPEIGKSLGEGIRGFREAMSGKDKSEAEPPREAQK